MTIHADSNENSNTRSVFLKKQLVNNNQLLIGHSIQGLDRYNTSMFHKMIIYNVLLKVPHHSIGGQEIFKKLVRLNTKCGFKHRTYRLFCEVIVYVCSYFEEFDKDLSETYPAYITLVEFSRAFPDEFCKLDFFLKYLCNTLFLIFILKKIKPKKKMKKRKKTPLKIKISYISQRQRLGVTIRLINAYINSSPERLNVHRLGDALLYLLLAGKESFLYKKKVLMYSKLLERKKFY